MAPVRSKNKENICVVVNLIIIKWCSSGKSIWDNTGKRSAHLHLILLMIFYNVKSIIDHYIELFELLMV